MVKPIQRHLMMVVCASPFWWGGRVFGCRARGYVPMAHCCLFQTHHSQLLFHPFRMWNRATWNLRQGQLIKHQVRNLSRRANQAYQKHASLVQAVRDGSNDRQNSGILKVVVLTAVSDSESQSTFFKLGRWRKLCFKCLLLASYILRQQPAGNVQS